jgi:cyclase
MGGLCKRRARKYWYRCIKLGKESLNSSAVRNPDLISESSREFGAQCIVIAIDARRKVNNVGTWEVYVKGGRENTGIDVLSWAKKV